MPPQAGYLFPSARPRLRASLRYTPGPLGGEVRLPFASNNATRAWDLVNKLSDQELALEVLSGAHDALAVLFDRYHKLVFGVAYKIVGDVAEAEEVVQTVFLEAFRTLANFDTSKGTLKVWLLQIAYSRALNRRRHLSAHRFYDLVSLDSAVVDLSAFQSGAHADVAYLVEQLLASLGPRRRTVVELTYFEGLTAKEIAARMGIPADHVRHELYRGLDKLRKAIKGRIPAVPRADDDVRDRRKEVLTPDAQPL